MEGWSWDSWIEIPPHIELVRLPLTPSFFFFLTKMPSFVMSIHRHIFSQLYIMLTILVELLELLIFIYVDVFLFGDVYPLSEIENHESSITAKLALLLSSRIQLVAVDERGCEDKQQQRARGCEKGG